MGLIPLVVSCDYTVIDHVISHLACFSILIVSKMSASTSSDYPAKLSSTTCPSASYMSNDKCSFKEE